MTSGLFGRVKVMHSNLTALSELSSMVVVASCSEAVLLPVAVVHCIVDETIKWEP